MAIPALNDDILAYILSFVSSPRDILSVCLSNKRLSSLANPELLYRSVRCRLGNNAVWEHLIANPVKASRVRELEVMRENFGWLGNDYEIYEKEHTGRLDLVGRRLTKKEVEDRAEPRLEDVERSEQLLIQALKVLVNLESFKWDRWWPVINQGSGHFISQDEFEDGEGSRPIYEEDIWTTLRDHTQVRRIWAIDLGKSDTIVLNPRYIFDSTVGSSFACHSYPRDIPSFTRSSPFQA